MRSFFLFLSGTLIILSCNNSSTTKQSSDTTVANKNESVVPNADRPIIIAELKRLKEIFSSKDKEKIATLFNFPIADSIVGYITDDESFYKEYRNNGDKTTREMFNTYFPKIYEGLQMGELNILFKNIQLDELIKKDTLEYEVHQLSVPCYSFYTIEVENDNVKLSSGTGVNHDFKPLHPPAEDEVAENSSEMCEHVHWWLFKFDGKKLNLTQIAGAD